MPDKFPRKSVYRIIEKKHINGQTHDFECATFFLSPYKSWICEKEVILNIYIASSALISPIISLNYFAICANKVNKALHLHNHISMGDTNWWTWMYCVIKASMCMEAYNCIITQIYQPNRGVKCPATIYSIIACIKWIVTHFILTSHRPALTIQPF